MKKILIRIKQTSKNLLTNIVKHEKTVLALFMATALFAVWSFAQEIEHNAEILDMERDITVLSFQLEHSAFASEEKSAMIIIQSEILNRQKVYLNEAERALESQHKLIQRLLNELEDAGVMPGKKFDPKRSI
jgi:hypothetical protein